MVPMGFNILDIQAHLQCFDQASVAEMFEECINDTLQNFSCGEELLASCMYIVQ